MRHPDEAGIPVVPPAGRHAVCLDARRFLPQIQPLEYPGLALATEFYIEAGIRPVEIGSLMFGLDPHTGEEHPALLQPTIAKEYRPRHRAGAFD